MLLDQKNALFTFATLIKGIFFLALAHLLGGCESISVAKEEAARDQLIIRHVKHALYKNEVVPKSGHHFGVTAKKGVVTLTGVADNINQMNDAVAIANRSQGVTAVENEITVGGGSSVSQPSDIDVE